MVLCGKSICLNSGKLLKEIDSIKNSSNKNLNTLWGQAKGKHDFISLLEDATTLYPCIAYERLEHLGDTILGYFVSINLFSRNFNFKWNSDDLVCFFSFPLLN